MVSQLLPGHPSKLQNQNSSDPELLKSFHSSLDTATCSADRSTGPFSWEDRSSIRICYRHQLLDTECWADQSSHRLEESTFDRFETWNLRWKYLS